MFGLGMPEILMILAIALIVIGPKKLPDLAKTLGRAMGEFKRSAQDFKRSIDVETTVKEFKSGVDIPKADLNKILTDDSPSTDETDNSIREKVYETDKEDTDKENKKETGPDQEQNGFQEDKKKPPDNNDEFDLENDHPGETDKTSEQDKIDK